MWLGDLSRHVVILLASSAAQELEQRSAELQKQSTSTDARQPEPAHEEMLDAVQPAAEPIAEEPRQFEIPPEVAAEDEQPAEAVIAQQEQVAAAATQPEGSAVDDHAASSRETPFKEATPGDGGTGGAHLAEAETNAVMSPDVPDVRPRACCERPDVSSVMCCHTGDDR